MYSLNSWNNYQTLKITADDWMGTEDITMTPMTFIKLCNYCSDVGNVETASAFYATPKTTK